MRQFITIASNAFMELVRQPVFLLLMTCSAVFEVFLAVPFYFAFGEELKLVKNTALAVMLLAGLLGAVLCASASLAREIRTGTALAVLSKPVGRAQFLLAKYAGLVLALALLTYVNTVAALLASRMAFDAYGSTDLFATFTFAGAVIVAYLLGGFTNFFLRRPFVSDAVLSLMLMVTIAFIVISFFTKDLKPQTFAKGVDWRIVPAAVLILFALWILAGLALACSTRLDIIPTLAICSAFFLLGIMSDYLFGRKAAPVWEQNLKEEAGSQRWSDAQKTLLKQIAAKYETTAATNNIAEPTQGGTPIPVIAPEDKARLRQAGMGGSWWASILYTVTPNWQLFWFGDTLESDQAGFNWGYVAKAFIYVLAYVGATLAVAAVLFGERELS
jgi:ABC-type transport system involved in multi-copper enzyme maturation permease subunit